MPDQLRNAVNSVSAGVEYSTLRRASEELTAAYKRADFAQRPLRSAAHRVAYTLVRMPATYAANVHVLERLKATVPDLAPRSVLDLGSGPGTSSWAMADLFPTIEKMTLLERDTELIELGRTLARQSTAVPLREAEWLSSDLAAVGELPDADLVMISYAVGELGGANRVRLIEGSWRAARQALVVIEPGTRRGFEIVLSTRERFIRSGIEIAAPCPHTQSCPMASAGDWCHFAQRIERGSEHRRLKDGALGYEDEKFSYVAASRLPVSPPDARIVRHSQIFSGFVKLDLCSGPVLEQRTVTRSQKLMYKDARHARWGDGWNS